MKKFCTFLLLLQVVFQLTLPSVWAQKHGGPDGEPIIDLGAATKPITLTEFKLIDNNLRRMMEQIQINSSRCRVVPEKNLDTIMDLEKFLLKNAGTREELLGKAKLKKNCIKCFQNENISQDKLDLDQCLFLNLGQKEQFDVIIYDEAFTSYLEVKYHHTLKISQSIVDYFKAYLKYIR